MEKEKSTDLREYFHLEKLPLGYNSIQAIPLKDIRELKNADRFSTSKSHFASLFQKETLYKPVSDLNLNFSQQDEK